MHPNSRPKNEASSKTVGTNRYSDSKQKVNTYSQDLESFLSIILQLIISDEVKAQKQINKINNKTLKYKFVDLNKKFNYFKYRDRKLSSFKDYLQTLLQKIIKNDLIEPSISDYSYDLILQQKLLEQIVRLTNNSKILFTTIEGKRPKVEEYYKFGTSDLIKFVNKALQKESLTKMQASTLNEQYLIDEFTKLSNGTFNKLNTKMAYYCKQKALDLLQSINSQILSKQKIKCQCANNNLVYQRRDAVKNIGQSKQKIQNNQLHYFKQDPSATSSKNLQDFKNLSIQLQKENNKLNEINQRLGKQIKNKQQVLKQISDVMGIQQQNKRLLAQVNRMKESYKEQRNVNSQLKQINTKMKEASNLLELQNQFLKLHIITLIVIAKKLQAKLQENYTMEDNYEADITKYTAEIQLLNKKVNEQQLLIKQLQKQHVEFVEQRDRNEQKIKIYEQQIIQCEECLSNQRKERRQIQIEFDKIKQNQKELRLQNKILSSELKNVQESIQMMEEQKKQIQRRQKNRNQETIEKYKQAIEYLIKQRKENKISKQETNKLNLLKSKLQLCNVAIIDPLKYKLYLQEQNKCLSQLTINSNKYEVQNRQNQSIIQSLKNQNKQLSDSLQTLMATQNQQRQQHFYFQSMLLKTIFYNNKTIQQIKCKIFQLFGNFTPEDIEYNSQNIIFLIQSVKFYISNIINFVRKKEEQIEKFNEQSLKQCQDFF